jgi:hypothetical protein
LNDPFRFELCSHVRKLGRKPTTAQRLELANKRRKLKTRITSFASSAAQYLRDDALDTIYDVEEIVLEDEVSTEEEADQGNTALTVADPERQVLPFPSALTAAAIAGAPAERRGILMALRTMELELREGHADDALGDVRKAVIRLSWEFKNTHRTALSGEEKSRAWDKAKVLTRIWKLHRKVYNHNRNVMMKLADNIAVGTKYPYLDIKDCQASTTVSDVNEPGGSTYRLPWYWSSSVRVATTSALDGEHENECNAFFLYSPNDSLNSP